MSGNCVGNVMKGNLIYFIFTIKPASVHLHCHLGKSKFYQKNVSLQVFVKYVKIILSCYVAIYKT